MNVAEEFVAVRKNNEGDIVAFKTTSGRELSYEEALQAIESHQIKGVNIGASRGPHRPVIRGNADGDPQNNLDNLPTF